MKVSKGTAQMSGISKLTKSSVSFIAVAALLAPVNALAQDNDEIIVTARKKEETLLDAPLAVSAFGEVELEEAGYVNIIDISKAAPGLFIEEFNQGFARIQTTPRFRGVFFSSGSRLQQTATVFLDGIYMSGGIQTLGVNELQSVEIIKGPQSALFGRNTFAGAIAYTTKNPGDEFRVDLDATAATRDEYRLSGSVEGPIAEGVSFRLSGMYEDSAGHYDNVAVPGTKLGDESQFSVNGTLFFEPSDNMRLKLRGSYREVDDGAPAAQQVLGINSHNFGGFLLNGDVANLNDQVFPAPRDGSRTESVFRGTIVAPDESTIGLNSSFADIQNLRDDYNADPRGANAARLKYNVLNVDEYGLKLDSFRLAANGEFDINDNTTFTFLAGYNKENYGRFFDFDNSGDASFSSFASNEIEDYSLEARLSGTAMDDKLTWSAGGSLVDIDILGVSGTSNDFNFFLGFFDDIFREDPFNTSATTLGAFASAEYQFTDQFSVSLEGRYQEDKIRDADVAPGEAKITNFLPRATLRYQPSGDTTLYATYSEGNLPGGFNPQVASLDSAQLTQLQAQAPGASEVFGEEKLENFELGWKQNAFDGALSVNTAAFYMKRTDEIFRSIEVVDVTNPEPGGNPERTVAFTQNGAATDIYGIEIDGVLDVNDNISLQGSFAYIDAKIASFPDGVDAGDFNDLFGDAASVKGQVAPRFPPISASFGGTFEQPFDGFEVFDTWFTRADIYYTGNYWDSNSNVAEVDVAVDTNIRTGLRGDNMSLELFVTNLFNENAPTAASNFADVTFDTRTRPGGFFDFSREGTTIGLRDKRQVGVRAKYTFK